MFSQNNNYKPNHLKQIVISFDNKNVEEIQHCYTQLPYFHFRGI